MVMSALEIRCLSLSQPSSNLSAEKISPSSVLTWRENRQSDHVQHQVATPPRFSGPTRHKAVGTGRVQHRNEHEEQNRRGCMRMGRRRRTWWSEKGLFRWLDGVQDLGSGKEVGSSWGKMWTGRAGNDKAMSTRRRILESEEWKYIFTAKNELPSAPSRLVAPIIEVANCRPPLRDLIQKIRVRDVNETDFKNAGRCKVDSKQRENEGERLGVWVVMYAFALSYSEAALVQRGRSHEWAPRPSRGKECLRYTASEPNPSYTDLYGRSRSRQNPDVQYFHKLFINLSAVMSRSRRGIEPVLTPADLILLTESRFTV
ncbi:hypothetical protein C8R43DRAFT_958684 [Mycena crocata]|nr:hypothetical protein C8R43DRAFT_958684 [Mycena crocata]